LAEAGLFAAAASGVQTTVTFESSPVGAFTNLTIAPGVTINGSDFLGNPLQILSAPLCGSVCGFNTTQGGANYVSLGAGTLTFSFTHPIDAFGAYFTGVQLGAWTVQFNDGSPHSLTLPNPGSSGGVMFYGFTDNGNKINSITVNLPAVIAQNIPDFIGVDDVTFARGTVSTTPLPAVLPLFATGLGAAGRLSSF
jgi:hypothetical protein